MHRVVVTVLVGLVALSMFKYQAVCKPPLREEKKSHNLMKLCGTDFMHAWKLECLLKLGEHGRARRSIEDFNKPKDSWFLPEKSAKSFMKRYSRNRRNLDDEKDTALEECCLEGCTLEEVAEYSC